MEQVKLKVEDINDTPPVFEDLSTVKFSEDTLPGETIASLRAFDADLNSHVAYSITQGDKNTFNIDPASGDLSLLKTVDREQVETFRLGVRADDGKQFTDINIIITVRTGFSLLWGWINLKLEFTCSVNYGNYKTISMLGGGRQ